MPRPRRSPGQGRHTTHDHVSQFADWIIDLGPGAGHDGGRITFEGAPAELIADGSTLTGKHLAEYVGN